MTDSIKHFTGFDISKMKLFEAARGMGIDVDKTMGKGKLMKSLALNAKEIIFNQLLSRIIQKRCHLSTTAIIPAYRTF
jgi:hypothetical protein